MKLVIVGYGKMGKAIESVARERKHEILKIIDADNAEELGASAIAHADAAIEFTTPESAYANYQKLFEKHIPVVTGTTGWLDRMHEIQQQCRKEEQTFFYAPNFNIGVNIFFAASQKLASLINNAGGYNASVEEIHHVHKKDAPSGTAIKLAEILTRELSGKTGWSKGATSDNALIPVYSRREDEIPGTHHLRFDSDMDSLTFTHEAKSRKGFALGAVLAAEFVYHKTGFYTMQDMLKF